jgi:hypothetical protein
MRLEMALVVMLVSFGNAALAGHISPLPLDEEDQQGLRFCFANGEELYGAAAWFDRLREQGCTRLCCGEVEFERHVAEADRAKCPAYRDQFIGATYQDGSQDIWLHKLVSYPKRDRYPHGYYGLDLIQVTALQPPDVPPATDQVIANFLTVLATAATYADSHDLGNFGNCFRQAQQALTNPTPPKLQRWLPPSAPEAAVRLLAAADHAYVFGTMGSWNDVPFLGDADYEAVTSDLIDAIRAATTHAANLCADSVEQG